MKNRWSDLGGQLGVGFCAGGILLIFLGWNGAASWDRVPSQLPYLISGGASGLALVVIGAALMIVQSHRADRALLEGRLEQLRETLERTAASRNGSAATPESSGLVLAGSASFHTPGCRVLEGRSGLPLIPVEEALARDLSPCRTCDPTGEQAPPARVKRAAPAKRPAPAKRAARRPAAKPKTASRPRR